MPSTIAEVDAAYQWDWTKWPVPEMPDLPLDPWAGVPGKDGAPAFWHQPVKNAQVDVFRTNALPQYDLPMVAHGGDVPWQGSSYGMPFQLINSAAPTTPVWDQSRPITWTWFTPTFPIVRVPLPNVVRREGDPGGSSDLHWTGYDPTRKVLWEGITLRKSALNKLQTWGKTEWIAGYNGGGPAFSRWDTSKPWDAPGQPLGVVAANVPKFPLLARWEEIKKGRINHALFGVLPNYSPERTGPARGGDGSWVGHPVRAGERLRLRRAVVERFLPGTAARILAEALWEFGYVQADRNDPTLGAVLTGKGNFSLTMDSRWAKGDSTLGPLGKFELRLKDFEVVTPGTIAPTPSTPSDTYRNLYESGY